MARYEEISKPKTCPWCGKTTGKFIQKIECAAGEPYTGNARVISRKPRHRKPQNEVDIDVLRITHDLFRDFHYGQFDTLRCAEYFANAAYRSGYQIK